MTDAVHKEDVYGKERKALRRAAHPEVKTKFPPTKPTRKGRFGISYRWNNEHINQKTFRRWFQTERARDQALAKMRRPYNFGSKRVHYMFKDVEKVQR